MELPSIWVSKTFSIRFPSTFNAQLLSRSPRGHRLPLRSARQVSLKYTKWPTSSSSSSSMYPPTCASWSKHLWIRRMARVIELTTSPRAFSQWTASCSPLPIRLKKLPIPSVLVPSALSSHGRGTWEPLMANSRESMSLYHFSLNSTMSLNSAAGHFDFVGRNSLAASLPNSFAVPSLDKMPRSVATLLCVPWPSRLRVLTVSRRLHKAVCSVLRAWTLGEFCRAKGRSTSVMMRIAQVVCWIL
mmetsp:Transcript_33861/g.86790  ORF Transcript_33861/g.86790 Transcript_33861/m.86790 type:complete len:244 (+) Transcript_33861:598-1329(+)